MQQIPLQEVVILGAVGSQDYSETPSKIYRCRETYVNSKIELCLSVLET